MRGFAPDREGSRAPGLSRNPISLFGAMVAVLGLAALTYALGLQLFGVHPSPYIGILAYLIFPGVLVSGLLLIPAGMAWEARRRAMAARRGRGIPPAFRIDLANPRHMRGVFLFGLSTAVILGALGAAGYRAVEFTDSVTFCGEICHEVMEPQYGPYKRSAHAEVPCVTCHIGEGASWWVQAKLSGLEQVAAVAFDSYPRPIPAPIENLRPARETCEECHWRERTYGLRLMEYSQYLPDKFNTEERLALAFRVGTGGEPAHGVHWHTAAELWYRAADRERQIIGWVGVQRPEGMEEWTNRSVPAEQLGEPRLMDCVDCHNRTAHEVPTPEQLVDEALSTGRMDRNLPYLKREALRLLFADHPNPDADVLAATWRQEGWFEQLRTFYEDNYPLVALGQAHAIDQAIDELESIAGQVIYPDMNVTWLTYLNNLGHVPQRLEAGCFRCHDRLESVETGEMLPSARCEFCHYDVRPEEIEGSGTE